MSWHFLQGVEAASWEGPCLDGAPSALLRLIPTAKRDSLTVSGTDNSQASRSGTTSAPSTVSRGATLSMSSAAASPVRTSAPQDVERASTAKSPDSGWKWRESSVKYDPDTRSWRTRQCSLLGGSEEFSGTWPRWGSMRDGECWELPTLVRPISVTVSGLLPTPVASAYGSNQGGAAGRVGPVRHSLQAMASKNMWPTIKATDGDRGGRGDLIQALRGNHNSHFKLWPTPTTQDAENNGGPSQARRNTPPLNVQAGGPLNPTWVEWLMGWPLGWTDCEPLEMDKFRQWLRLHGGCL